MTKCRVCANTNLDKFLSLGQMPLANGFLTEAEITKRFESYKLPEPRYKSGVLSKYSKLVSGADSGAVTS